MRCGCGCDRDCDCDHGNTGSCLRSSPHSGDSSDFRQFIRVSRVSTVCTTSFLLASRLKRRQSDSDAVEKDPTPDFQCHQPTSSTRTDLPVPPLSVCHYYDTYRNNYRLCSQTRADTITNLPPKSDLIFSRLSSLPSTRVWHDEARPVSDGRTCRVEADLPR